MWAVGQGKEKIVELLLKYGVDVHIKDSHGRTAKDLAKRNYGRQDIIQLLENVS